MKKNILNMLMGVVLLLSLLSLKFLSDFSNPDAKNTETITPTIENTSQVEETAP